MEFNQMESTDLQDPRGRENKEEIRIIEALAKINELTLRARA